MTASKVHKIFYLGFQQTHFRFSHASTEPRQFQLLLLLAKLKITVITRRPVPQAQSSLMYLRAATIRRHPLLQLLPQRPQQRCIQ